VTRTNQPVGALVAFSFPRLASCEVKDRPFASLVLVSASTKSGRRGCGFAPYQV
jgi:hypothetical protein